MRLSIITINYNNRFGLEKTIESIISQSFKDFEWIIIDGGSSDGSKEIIENLQNSNISYWCSEHDSGIYNALNKGIQYCHGDYVCCMNSGDSFFEHDTLKKVFSENPIEDVLYGDVYFDYGYKVEYRTYPYKLSVRWLYNNTLNHQTVFCKAKILKEYMFDERYKIMADRKLWILLYLNGFRFHHLHIIVARYDRNGISASDGNTWLNEFIQLHDEIIPHEIQQNRFLFVIYIMFIECRRLMRRYLN